MKTPKTRFTLKVRAGARKTEFAGRYGDAWKLHVAAPPVDGKANDAIVSFIARLACVRPGSVHIVGGQTSPMKIVEIEGIDSAGLERVILESNGLSPDTGSAAARKA
jgi:uncharacterized protein